MFKRILATALLACTIPAMASAATPWQLTTQASTAGGSITSRNMTAQTSSNGSIFKSYTTSKTIGFTVATNTGYSVNKIVVNGTTYPAGAGAPATVKGLTAQTVSVAFSPAKQSVTAVVGMGGTVSPASVNNIYYGTKLLSPLVFTFTPQSGFNLNALAGAAGATVAPTVPAAVNTAVKVTYPAGYVFTAPVALSGTFVGIKAIAGAPQTVLVNKKVTLNGAASVGATSYAWTQTAGTAVTLSGDTTAAPFFTPTLLGSYTFKLVINGSSAPDSITVAITDSMATAMRNDCVNCHIANNIGVVANVWSNYSTGGHKRQGVACYSCHTGAGDGGHPGVVDCSGCHKNAALVAKGQALNYNTCVNCHAQQDVHAAVLNVSEDCIGCHSVAVQHPDAYNAVTHGHDPLVNDNNEGVRAITTEFAKWSHHVTGVDLQNQHCTVCHLEGKINAAGTGVIVDPAYHMKDASTHLRNVDDDAAEFVWTPAAPNFSTMDNFCLNCHDGNGATSAKVAAIMATATPAVGKLFSATNPFADTISNQYDKMERSAVVDAKGQFATGNNSHHAVLGKKYTGRTRVAGSRQIAQAVAFNINSSANLPGKRSTIFDATKFEATYTTLANTGGETDVEGTLNGRNGGSALGDDSTLHCGDCHTVGQFRTADVGTKYNKAVIGAHGSNNEYMLRNNVGSDAKHVGAENAVNGVPVPDLGFGTKPYLVCYNCHAFNSYNSILGHAGEKSDGTNCNGSFNTVGNSATGEARLLSWNGKTGVLAGKEFGNILGIQCANCHNSGSANALGGIHGSKVQTYADGLGNTTNVRHFLPGLGNSKFVPGTRGGYDVDGVATGTVTNFYNYSGAAFDSSVKYTYTTGGVTSDLNWEQAAATMPGTIQQGAGCYTISPTGDKGNGAVAGQVAATDGQTANGTELFGNWGGCDDHNSVQGGADHGFTRKVLRKVTY